MFEQQKSAPFYKSRTLLISAAVVVVLVVAVFGVWRYLRRQSTEAHYAELEQHRQRQAAEAAAIPAATAAPVTQASPGASPGQTAAAPAAPTQNYWTNFRGPKRDGNYEAMPVLTSWPSNGLTPIWKQPVGLGYSSFTIADGRAYTIEQRRGQ